MAAELGRPAELDRAHHTPLDTPEMAVMNLPIRLAVAAEDIRHLQSRRHGRNRSARRHHFNVQPLERARRAPDEAVRDLGVACRRGKIGVTEQHLDDADVGAVLQKMGGKGVPEHVDSHTLVDAGGDPRRAAGRIQHLHVDGAIGATPGKQPDLRLCQTQRQ